MWVDFLADVGDSWEATYAVASLMVDPNLRGKFPESARQDIPKQFGPAQVVVVGGDLVYPMASRDGYRRRFHAPFAAALPKRARKPDRPSPRNLRRSHLRLPPCSPSRATTTGMTA